MIALMAPVGALLLAVAMLLMGNGLQSTLLPIRAEMEDFSTFSVGVLGSSYFLGFALGCVLAPYAVRRVGHARAFAALVSVAAAVALAHALVVVTPVWWALRMVTGFCFAGLYLVIESWLNDYSTNETRGTILAVYTVINLTVITVGQLMITLYDPKQFALFALVSILISLASVPVAMSRAHAPTPPVKIRIRPLHLYRLSPVGFAGTAVVGIANGAFWGLAPLYARHHGLELREVAVFMGIAVLGGAVMQWPLGWLSDRRDRRGVIAVGCALAAAAGIGLTLVENMGEHMLLPAAAIFGAFAFPLYALCIAHANDMMAKDEFVEASSGLLLGNGLGSAVGPILASVLMSQLGGAGLFLFTAAAHAVLSLFVVYRMTRRAVPAEDHARFVALPQTTQELVVFDPRAEEEKEEQQRQQDESKSRAA